MFNSLNPFMQPSSSPFPSQQVSGQTANASSLFAPKPFGSTSTFGSQTGNSVFGGTSTGVFGATQFSSPFSSTTTFGGSSSPAFGASLSPFGSTSSPAFGSSSSSPFGGSSSFGQKPQFGGFGSTSTQTNTFGSTNQQSQPTFGSTNLQSQPAFGTTNQQSQPVFGSTNQQSRTVFGSTNQQSRTVFGSTNQQSQPAFGSTNQQSQPTFGSTNQQSQPAFGSTNQQSQPVFGSTNQQSQPAFGSTNQQSQPTFGSTNQQSQPAFGSTNQQSQPAFGSTNQQSQPAFGSTNQQSQPAFGSTNQQSQPAFGSTNQQSQPTFESTNQLSQPTFGSTNQQSQPAFGSNVFSSSSPFGAASQTAFGASSTLAFGATSSTPPFGATSTSAFGATSTPVFGSTSTPAFGATSTPVFGATSPSAFGSTTTPAFGSTTSAFGSSGNAFGTLSTPCFGSGGGFGASSTPAFGVSNTSFGAPSASAFGPSSTPSLTFGSTSALGQSTSAFGSNTCTTSPFGAQSSPFGTQSATTFTTSSLGHTSFGGQCGGSRVAPFAPTPDPDAAGANTTSKFQSMSVMPNYKDKSHEELRWEDYQSGDKGGPLPAGHSNVGVGFGVSTAQPNLQASSTFSQSNSNPFSTAVSTNPPKSSGFGIFGPSTTFSSNSSTPAPSISTNLFSMPSTASNPFASTTPASTSSFPSSTTPQLGNSSLFSLSNAQPFSSQPAISSTTSLGTNPTFPSNLNFNNTQSSPLFQPTTPSIGQTGSAFAALFSQPSMFSQPSSGAVGNLFSSSSSLQISSNPTSFGQSSTPFSMPFQQPQPQPQPQAPTSLFSNLGHTQPNGSSSFAGTSNIFGQSNFGQSPITQSPVVQPTLITNPFGTLPTSPPMSFSSKPGAAPSIQYGISRMPVVDKAAPVRISSLLTPCHLSHRRMRYPMRKYNPQNDGRPRVPFFSADEETLSTVIIPRENPRALVICPTDKWPLRAGLQRVLPSKDTSLHGNGNVVENGTTSKDSVHPNQVNQKPNGVHEDRSASKEDLYRTFGGHRAGEAAIVYEHGADIEALMPKLRHSDYYTEPKIQELAAKERAEPGFCCRVKDFVVGRHGYGSIKFFGGTDVRRLDLESIVQFNNREVIVYLDESKKPPLGQGLNKPAEVTLLNIKCFNKKTGHQYTEGPKVEKYKELLRKKTEAQGAEFVSHDTVKGEWKFRVDHFSRYSME